MNSGGKINRREFQSIHETAWKRDTKHDSRVFWESTCERDPKTMTKSFKIGISRSSSSPATYKTKLPPSIVSLKFQVQEFGP
jgi:hypothetical protein